MLLKIYAVIVGSRADFVRRRFVSSCITGFFLFLASVFVIECLVELFDDCVILQLSITRCICHEIDVCFILQQWVVPTAEYLSAYVWIETKNYSLVNQQDVDLNFLASYNALTDFGVLLVEIREQCRTCGSML